MSATTTTVWGSGFIWTWGSAAAGISPTAWFTPPAVAASVYEPVSDLAQSNPLSNLQNNPSPFLTTIFGFRLASRTHIPAKGFIQSSPLVNFTAMGGKDEVESTIQRHYRGTAHPMMPPSLYSFSMAPVAGKSLCLE